MEDFWANLEKEFRAYEPGTRVMYRGATLNAHGIWIVHSEVGDERYTLRCPQHTWERLNADREDLTPVEDEEYGHA